MNDITQQLENLGSEIAAATVAAIGRIEDLRRNIDETRQVLRRAEA